MGVVPRQVPEGAVQVPSPTVQLDQNPEGVISNIGPRAGAHGGLPAPGRKVMRSLDVVTVSLLQRALDAREITEDLCDQPTLGESGSAFKGG